MEQKQQPPYPLRIPVDLRSRLEKEAESQRRSLNAEISDRLERSFGTAAPAEDAIRAMAISLAEAQHDRTIVTLERETFLVNLAFVCQLLDAAAIKLGELRAERFIGEHERSEFQAIRRRVHEELAQRTDASAQELVDAMVASRKQLSSARDAFVSSKTAEQLKRPRAKEMTRGEGRDMGANEIKQTKPRRR